MRELIKEYLKTLLASRSMMWFFLSALIVIGTALWISLPRSDLLMIIILGFRSSSYELIRFMALTFLCCGVLLISFLRINSSSKTDPRNWILMTEVSHPKLIMAELVNILCVTLIYALVLWTPLNAAATLSGHAVNTFVENFTAVLLINADLLLAALLIMTLPLNVRVPLLLAMLIGAGLGLVVCSDICCRIHTVYITAGIALGLVLVLRIAGMRRRLRR